MSDILIHKPDCAVYTNIGRCSCGAEDQHRKKEEADRKFSEHRPKRHPNADDYHG